MKTKMNISKVAKMSFISFSMLVLSAFITVQAGNSNDTMAANAENQASLDRLENLANTIEISLKYEAHAVAKDVLVFEAEAAMERLEDLIASIEKSVKYEAPTVNEEA